MSRPGVVSVGRLMPGAMRACLLLVLALTASGVQIDAVDGQVARDKASSFDKKFGEEIRDIFAHGKLGNSNLLSTPTGTPALHTVLKDVTDVGSVGLPCRSTEIPNSNRDANNPCTDVSNAPGTECDYTCDNGYVAVGRHVCQWHDPDFINETRTNVVRTNNFSSNWDTNLAKYAFWGGRCERLCGGVQACGAGESPRRYASMTEDCLVTQCFANSTANLKNVARGVYEVMQLGRDDITGVYFNALNFNYFIRKLAQKRANLLSSAERYKGIMDRNFSIDATALGILTEVVGAALAFQTPDAALQKVTETLETLSLNSSAFPRDSRGFFSHIYAHKPGSVHIRPEKSSPMSSGLLISCALFAVKYFMSIVASRDQTQQLLFDQTRTIASQVADLGSLVDALYKSMDFSQILCSEKTGELAKDGTSIPYAISFDGSRCGDWTKHVTKADGLYAYDEEHAAVYLAYQQVCGSQPAGSCDNAPIELMWNRWQARRLRPNVSDAFHYASRPILTKDSGFTLQLMHYTTSSFNADDKYEQLFYNHWLSDYLYHKQFMFAGKRGRYGLGEGPLAAWCDEGKTYDQNRLIEKEGTITPGKREGAIIGARDHCSAFSAYSVAGYMPVDPQVITGHLLALLEDGETVVPVPGTDYAVLWRSSIAHYKMYGQGRADLNRDFRITLVDLAPQLFGLSTLFLPKDFYQKFSKHFDHDGEYDGPTTPKRTDLKGSLRLSDHLFTGILHVQYQ